MKTFDIGQLDFTKGQGLVTVVAQDAVTGMVLMVAHADRQALELTVTSGEMHYTSRTRGLWHKGATSGNVLRVVSLYSDCDGDAVLARVVPMGPACHTETTSCFGDPRSDIVDQLDRTISSRARAQVNGEKLSYTQRLLADRNTRLKKIGEEAAEFVLACSDGDPDGAANEAADLLYHVLVALRALDISYLDLQRILASRHDNAASIGL
jgi:phosphoribosyl-ATP pyrophosphohydrolase/phosphoribosyl-AMP cyclohydrolase